MGKLARKCILCGDHDDLDGHHIFPVEYGGADDGPMVDLCSKHHREVHRLASAVWKKELALSSVTPPDKQKLVKAIHDQHTAFVQSGGVAPDARRRIVAELTDEEQQRVRLIKQHYGFKSIEAMLKALINREAERIQAGGNVKKR